MHVPAFLLFYYIQVMLNQYHNSISLYNMYSYMFRHFCVIIREL